MAADGLISFVAAGGRASTPTSYCYPGCNCNSHNYTTSDANARIRANGKTPSHFGARRRKAMADP